tara:strand:+ start:548 stop:907 length:360 start_codon:yes stop_codon:yes gene_type:complete
MEKISLGGKLSLFSEHWSPKVIAELNGHQVKLVKLQGEFVWHDHQDADEMFLVIEGKMFIEFEDETIELNSGEMLVVPRGVKHRPYAPEECAVMLVEPRGVVNTGDTESELTAVNDSWI